MPKLLVLHLRAKPGRTNSSSSPLLKKRCIPMSSFSMKPLSCFTATSNRPSNSSSRSSVIVFVFIMPSSSSKLCHLSSCCCSSAILLTDCCSSILAVGSSCTGQLTRTRPSTSSFTMLLSPGRTACRESCPETTPLAPKKRLAGLMQMTCDPDSNCSSNSMLAHSFTSPSFPSSAKGLSHVSGTMHACLTRSEYCSLPSGVVPVANSTVASIGSSGKSAVLLPSN
mmetsp:Transcript_33487/g.78293  ORF Transcript_33487/g.78293 Transcript_33487/m.78293 type:complete len:225 (+) Transcript_33487:469-1143(+)